MTYVKVKGLYVYQHKDNRLESVEPGSIVGMKDEDARSFIAYGMGEECEGPEKLIKPAPDKAVEQPGVDPKAARAEQATAGPQRR